MNVILHSIETVLNSSVSWFIHFYAPGLQVIEEILRLNEDSRVHGIFLHLPQTFLSKSVRNAIKSQKDVDGYATYN